MYSNESINEQIRQLLQPTAQPFQTRNALQRRHTGALEIRVPLSTEWEPGQTEQLMTSLYALWGPITLSIVATHNSIEWHLLIPPADAEAIKQTIYALYPHALIRTNQLGGKRTGGETFQLDSYAPFVGPLKPVTDLRDYDPLASVVNAMGTLGPGEQISYSLTLNPVRPEVIKEGEKLITQSAISLIHFFAPVGIIYAAERYLTGRHRAPAYIPEIQRTLESKLYGRLKEVDLQLHIQAAGKRRRQALARQMLPALEAFTYEGMNGLVLRHEESFPLVLSVSELAALWHPPSQQCQHPKVRWASSVQAPPPTNTNQPGVMIGINRYRAQDNTVYLDYADRISPVTMFGRPGLGKSTLMHRIIHQDIEAGHGVALIDPHGDLAERVLGGSIPPHREKDVIYFNVADQEFPIGLNLLAQQPGVEATEIASRTLAVVRKIFSNQWSATRMESAMYAALSALISVGGFTIFDVTRLFVDDTFRYKVLQQVDDPVALKYWRYYFEDTSNNFKMQVAQPIFNRLNGFYRNGTMRLIMGQTACLNFRDIIDNRKIFIANLQKLGEIEQETLGAALISHFQIAALSRGNIPESRRIPFYLHIDEVQNFITTSLPSLFSEARKFGVNLCVANQFMGQLSGGTLEAVLGTSGATIIFGVGPQDASALAPYVRPTFDGDHLLTLDKHHAVVRMSQQGKTIPAFNMKTLPPIQLPANSADVVERIVRFSQQQYGTPRKVVERAIQARFTEQDSSDSDKNDDKPFSYYG